MLIKLVLHSYFSDLCKGAFRPIMFLHTNRNKYINKYKHYVQKSKKTHRSELQ